MAKVVSFQTAADKRKEVTELEKIKATFHELIAEMTMDEKLQTIQALEAGDSERYFAITNPIIMRKAIRQVNS